MVRLTANSYLRITIRQTGVSYHNQNYHSLHKTVKHCSQEDCHVSRTIKDHASSNGCWVSYSLGHGGEAIGVAVHHQANVFGLQLASRVAKPHVVPQDDHVSLALH